MLPLDGGTPTNMFPLEVAEIPLALKPRLTPADIFYWFFVAKLQQVVAHGETLK